MSEKRYRVKSRCQECENEWNSKKKDNAGAVHSCPECGTTKTERLTAWTVKSDSANKDSKSDCSD